MNKVTLEHCKTALAQTRACLDRELYIALAVMCGVTCERYKARQLEVDKIDHGKRKSVLKHHTFKDWDTTIRSQVDRIDEIRDVAAHRAIEFDDSADDLSLEAWELLRELIKVIDGKPEEDMRKPVQMLKPKAPPRRSHP